MTYCKALHLDWGRPCYQSMAPPGLMHLIRQSSGGNMLPPRCQAAGCAQLLRQHQRGAVSTPVGGVPRYRTPLLSVIAQGGGQQVELIHSRLNVNQLVLTWPKRPMTSWPISEIAGSAELGKGLSPHTWHWWGCTLNTIFNLGLLTATKTLGGWNVSREGQQCWGGIWSTSSMRSSQGSWSSLIWRKGGREGPLPENHLKGVCSSRGCRWRVSLLPQETSNWTPRNSLKLYQGWLRTENFFIERVAKHQTGCPGTWLSHRPQRNLKAMYIWHLGI